MKELQISFAILEGKNSMITIFTPTYNRADKLTRVYRSLLEQSDHDFEWLIIDDGSVDDTESVVKSFDKMRIDIVYHKQSNGGKHRAYNRALEMARGEYFFCLDSDDWLADGAIKKILDFVYYREDKIIFAYKKDEKGKLLSDEFPEKTAQISLRKLNDDCHCNGEFSIIFRTDFARRFPFPVFEGENFITEAVVYDRMALEESVALLPKVITICEYQEEGLSNNLNRIMKKNPAGYCLYFMQRIDLQTTMIQRIVMAGKYQCFCRFSGKQRSEYTGNHPVTVTMAKPLGLLFLLYYKILRGF